MPAPTHLLTALLAALAAAFILPEILELYTIIQSTTLLSLALLALSLAIVWGQGGILCLGQTTFFGLAGYTYAVCAINFGNTTAAALLAVGLPTLCAAAMGYVLFTRRLDDVHLGGITLAITLILFKLANSTAGDAYTIGKARLGGFNGMPGIPLLTSPLTPTIPLSPETLFQLAIAALCICYIACKILIAGPFGRTIIALRENETRAQLLGYNPKIRKTLLFCIGAAIAALGGILFANTVFVSPNMFSLTTTAHVLIWVIAGGRTTLIGPIMACILLELITSALGTTTLVDPNIVLGLILVCVILRAPRGLLPLLASLWHAIAPRPQPPPQS